MQRCEVRDAVGDRLAVQHEDANLLSGPTARHHHNQLFHAQRPLHLILFRVACNMCLEGIVSKHRATSYEPAEGSNRDFHDALGGYMNVKRVRFDTTS